MITFFLIIFGLFLMTKGADFLIDGAVAFSKRLKVSELFTGLTVVAFGTSLPELVVSIAAATKGSGIAVGNVLGSNVANVGLILGLSFLIYPTKIKKSTVLYEIPFVIIITMAAVGLIIEDNGVMSRYDGLVLVSFLPIFLAYLYRMAVADREMMEELLSEVKEKERLMSWNKIWLLLITGFVGLILGGKLTVDNAIKFARMIGITETMIGVTIVAIGTSLPELVTSVMAAKKGAVDITVGNIVGSNAFNLLTVLGISSLVHKITPDREVTFDALWALILMIILEMFVIRRKARRFLGGILLFMYVIYIYINLNLG